MNQHSVSKLNIPAATTLVRMLNKIPIYIISGHSCIGSEIRDTGISKYGDIQFAFAFSVPHNTFLMSFVDPGSMTCLHKGQEAYIRTQAPLIRQFFYLHGPDEFLGHMQGSMFSRATRATGGPDTPIAYPNVFYTFEPSKGVPRGENEFGVFDISDQYGTKDMTNLESIIPQFDPSKPLDTINKADWTLEDIIKRVYEVTRTDKGIFINAGCMTPCHKGSKSIDKAARMMYEADAMYRNIIPVMGRRNIQQVLPAYLFTDHTHLPGTLIGALDLREFRRMLESGLYRAKAFEEILDEFHQDDREAAREIIREHVMKIKTKASAEAKRKASAEAKRKTSAEAKRT